MKKYTMQDFKEQKIAVTFANADEQKRFLQECDKHDLLWRKGQHALEYDPCEQDVTISYNFGGKNLSFWGAEDNKTSAKCAEEDGMTVISFASFDFAHPAPKKSEAVNVTSANNPLWVGVVTAEMTSQQVNAMLDELRAIRYSKRQAEKPTPPAEDKPVTKPKQQYREVDRAAKAGDKVRLISNGGFDFSKKGDVLIVSDVDEKGLVGVKPEHFPRTAQKRENGRLWHFRKTEYRVLEPITPEPTQPATQEYVEVKGKARVGDRIRITKPVCDIWKAGDEFTVKSVNWHGSGLLLNETSVMLWMSEYVILLPVSRENRRANVGEWVEIIKAEPCCALEKKYKNGDVLKIVGEGPFGHAAYGSQKYEWLFSNEYNVLVGYEPREEAK